MVALRCTKQDRQKIQSYAHSLTLLLAKYRWLTDAYVVEFFVKDHWHSLPTSWQKALDGLEPSQLAYYLSANKELRHTAVWPLSLLAFCATTQSLALNRYPREPPTSFGEDSSCQLDHCFMYHVKNKKRHEIQTLADIIHRMCKSSGVNRVVDVGGGQGHLSRLLSVGYGLKVMSIEAAGCHVDGAAKVDKKVEILMQKRKKKGLLDIPGQLPVHIVCTIDPDISVGEFVELVNQHMSLTSESTPAELGQVEPKSDVCDSGSSFQDNQSKDSCIKDSETCEGATRLKEDPIRVTGNLSPSVDESVSLQQVCLSSDSLIDLSSNEMKDTSLQHNNGLTSEPGASTLKPGISSIGITQDGDIGFSASEKRPANRERIASPKNGEDISVHHHLYQEGKSNLKNGFQGKNEYLQQSIVPECDAPSQSELSNSENGASLETFSLVGLHTCGDLGPTILRVFIRCHEAKVLALVGCCYMKMHCVQQAIDGMQNPGTATTNTGFPMSHWIRGLCENKLTFEPMELACHFFDTYYQRLKKNDDSLKLQVYRAMLEVLIQKEQPDLVRKHAGIKQIKKAISGIKKNHNVTFQSYAEAALKKLGLAFDPIAAKELEERCFPDWKRVIAFHCLRLCLAPIIESLLMVDRMLFLLENGVESELTAVFDPFISPRNFLLQATKT